MNRLFYNRCYLTGPIDNAKDFGTGWRQMVQQELTDLDLIFFDPCNKPMLAECACEDLENHKHRLRLKEQGAFDEVSRMMRTIRCIDLRLADLCDFSIAHLDLDVYSTGTHEEIVTLNRRKVPILTHVEQGKAALPDWYLGTLPHQMIFSTWAELFAYVRHVAHAEPPIDTFNRWRFFDYGTLYKKRTILLPDSLTAQISPEDHDYLNQWRWTAQRGKQPDAWYATRKYKLAGHLMTRHMYQDVAFRLGIPLLSTGRIEYCDHDSLNNTRENLIVCDGSTDTKKIRLSGNGDYCVEITILGTKHRLGAFSSLRKAQDHYGEVEHALLKAG